MNNDILYSLIDFKSLAIEVNNEEPLLEEAETVIKVIGELPEDASPTATAEIAEEGVATPTTSFSGVVTSEFRELSCSDSLTSENASTNELGT